MIRKKVVVAVLICLFAVIQTIPATALFTESLEDFRQLVLANNQELKVYEQQIADLEDAVSQVFHLDDSTLSLSGGYSYNDASSSTLHNFSGTTGLTIPVIDQLTLSTQLNSAGNGSVSVQLHPLADMPENVTQEQQLALLKLQYQSFREQLNYQGTIAVLQYVSAKQDYETAQALLDISRREYEYKQQQFDAGLLSAAELQQFANTFSSNSIQNINALNDRASKEHALLVLLSAVPVPAAVLDLPFTLSGLYDVILELEKQFSQLQSAGQFSSLQEQSLLIQKIYLEKELKNTWLIDPQLSLSGSYAVSDLFGTPVFSPIASVGVSLQIAVSDLYFEDKKDIQDSISELDLSMVLEHHSLQVTQAAQLGTLEIAHLSEEMAERNLSAMKSAEELAAYDYARENINQFTYEQIQLHTISAESNLFSALITVYSQLSNLIQSYTYTGTGAPQ